MKVVLLDRDGTVVVDPDDGCVNSLDKVELFPDTIEALKYLKDNGFSVIFVTNQTGIAKGIMTERDFWTYHEEILKRLEPSGIKVLQTYMNDENHGPNASLWLKPGPNMLLDAAKDFQLNLADVYMIGDNDTDVRAAINAGCKGGILVETATNKKVVSPDAVYTAPHLMDAVRFVVAN